MAKSLINMTKQFGWIPVALLMAISLPRQVIAQGMMDPVHFQITDIPKQIEPGQVFDLVIQAQMDDDWHLYSINNDPEAGPYPTKFTSLNENMEIAGEVGESKPVVEYDPNFDAQLGWHEKQGTFTIPLKFKGMDGGEVKIELQVFYQTCNDKFCLPPKKKTISGTVMVTGSTGEGEGVVELAIPPSGRAGGDDMDQQGALKSSEDIGGPAASAMAGEGILSFFWIAITAGFAALLTPCVFPMIPLTVSFFSKNKKTAGREIGKAVIFGLAIVATFTLLGVLLALLIGVGGANRFASNPWVNLFIGGVLIVFSISLLGAFELRLPYQMTNWLNRKSNEKSGIIGILFMALTISAVSFSCTAPFVGGVLAATAGGAWFYPIVGMIGFSAAFASPFILFALFPGWLESLPKSGSWMNIVKVLLGFIELAAAMKFISNADLVWNWDLVSRPFVVSIWIAIFLLAGLYVLGTYTLKYETKPETISTGRLMLSIPFLLFSFYLIPGLLGASLGIWDAWLPPKQATDVSVVYSIVQNHNGETSQQPNEFEIWSPDYQASVEKAKQESKPVFIDFTGYTCTNCRAMESNVFSLAAVEQQFQQMERVRIYTDDGENGPSNQKFQFELTGTVALPTYVIINPFTGKVIRKISGYTDKEEFLSFLQDGLQGFKQS